MELRRVLFRSQRPDLLTGRWRVLHPQPLDQPEQDLRFPRRFREGAVSSGSRRSNERHCRIAWTFGFAIRACGPDFRADGAPDLPRREGEERNSSVEVKAASRLDQSDPRTLHRIFDQQRLVPALRALPAEAVELLEQRGLNNE